MHATNPGCEGDGHPLQCLSGPVPTRKLGAFEPRQPRVPESPNAYLLDEPNELIVDECLEHLALCN
jgi:hypothetical protein